MNIQGIGQSFSAYQSMSMRGSQGMNRGFDPPSADSIMEKDDANLDGVLTVDETPMSEEMFSNADSDSDGQLNTEELEEMLSNRPPPMMGGGMGGGQSIMDAEDTDEDGSISSEESSLSSEVFSLLDTNEDGVISQEELEAAQVQRQENMNNTQELPPDQTVSLNQAINAYRLMESFMTNFSSTDYADSNLSSFIQTMA